MGTTLNEGRRCDIMTTVQHEHERVRRKRLGPLLAGIRGTCISWLEHLAGFGQC